MSAVFAWLVHLYTGLGLVCAAGVAVLIVRGDDTSLRLAFFLMMVATAIDATDGWLARKARVKDVLPHFDGRALDDVIDFQLYASLPLLLLWRADVLPGSLAWLFLLPLLAAGYGFSQVDAKTVDGFFLGFPSYWNIIAFFLFILHPAPWISALILVIFSILTFVPTPYLYATRGGPYAAVINIGAAIFFCLLSAILWEGAPETRGLTYVALLYPITYLSLSFRVAVTRSRQSNASRARDDRAR